MNIDSFEQLTTRIGRLRLRRCGSMPAVTIFVADATSSSYEEEIQAFYMELEKFYSEEYGDAFVDVGSLDDESNLLVQGPYSHDSRKRVAEAQSPAVGSKFDKTVCQHLHEDWVRENKRMNWTGGGTAPCRDELPFYLEPHRAIVRGEHNIVGIFDMSDDEENFFNLDHDEASASQSRV
ncbi:hypothetical protein ANCDUO_03391 [Ancylostoma duodenale]|uniref:Uncharacterized protein n=1 Tax=Ancylostoma duodenale TaxID=51022 RepID=A0A0C2GXM5_9BILA|nr:hypothetical protein ANCDUO_03391 [Ancylostoma duodenale]